MGTAFPNLNPLEIFTDTPLNHHDGCHCKQAHELTVLTGAGPVLGAERDGPGMFEHPRLLMKIDRLKV